MNYKYSDEELKEKLIKFIERTKNVMNMFDNKNIKENKEKIKQEYKKLKEDIKNEAHRVRLQRKQAEISNFEEMYYIPSVCESAAYGFYVSSNSKVNDEMWCALEEGYYRLCQSISLEELKNMK